MHHGGGRFPFQFDRVEDISIEFGMVDLGSTILRYDGGGEWL